MVELINWDSQVFHLINSEWSNAFFDFILPVLRNKYTWFPFYIFLISFLLINFRRHGLYILIVLAMTVGAADATSSHLVKKSVKRLRPCKIYNPPKEMNLLVRCGSGYSFPSSHATNHFAIAVFLVLLVKRRYRLLQLGLLLWAASIGYAQIYVGVHYPVDVIAGALLGTFIATLFYQALWKRMMRFRGNLC